MTELRLILLAAGVLLILGIYLYSRRAENKSTARSSSRREPSFQTFASDSDVPPQLREQPAGTDPKVVSAADVFGPVEASAGQQPGLVAEPTQGQVAQQPVAAAVEQTAGTVADHPVHQTTAPAASRFEQTELPLPEELRPETSPEPARTNGTGATSDVREKVIVIHVSARGGARFKGPAIIAALEAESLEFGDFNIYHRRSGHQSVYSIATMIEPGSFDLDNIEQLSTPGLSLFLVLPGPDSPVAAFTEMLSTARRLAASLGGEVLDESGSTLSRQAASHLREQIIEFAHRIR
ncbi:MAG: cell division protein ZipA [Gammaproteobacteria bacterium]|nr:cell division protein ZipA [Gammaproteobacteria bacterium]